MVFMTFYSVIILPFIFGLIGFFEPCSMGINMMFLSSVDRTNSVRRIKEIAVFMLVRALVLALLGLSVAFVGNRLFSFEQGFFIILASIYISIGLLMIFSKSLLQRLRNVRIAHLLGMDFKEGALNRLGLIAGLTIPACAIPLITVLLGQTFLLGKIFTGFITLFVFGLALTVPLAIFSFFKGGIIWLTWIAERTKKFRVIGGVILVLIGVATFYSGSYWNQAILPHP
jgi:cytochrome c-type biogenesis protein